jgi:hypothetical protein
LGSRNPRHEKGIRGLTKFLRRLKSIHIHWRNAMRIRDTRRSRMGGSLEHGMGRRRIEHEALGGLTGTTNRHIHKRLANRYMAQDIYGIWNVVFIMLSTVVRGDDEWPGRRHTNTRNGNWKTYTYELHTKPTTFAVGGKDRNSSRRKMASSAPVRLQHYRR